MSAKYLLAGLKKTVEQWTAFDSYRSRPAPFLWLQAAESLHDRGKPED